MKNINVNIKDRLPHREPMLMIDELTLLTNEKVETKLEIKTDNIFVYNNHFVEAGLIENIAQTCSIIVGSDFFIGDDYNKRDELIKVIGFISTIKKTQIMDLPKVGETIYSKGKLVSKLAGDGYTLCSLIGEISSQKKIYLNCEISLMIKSIES